MFLGAALFYVAANIQAGWLYILDFTFVAFWIAAWLFPRTWIQGKIGIERYYPKIFEGETLSVFLRITNITRKPKYFFLLEDRFPASISPESRFFLIPALKTGETKEFTYPTKAEKRGVYPGEAPVLRSVNPGAFFQWRKKIPCQTTLTVFPKPRSFAFPSRSLTLPSLQAKGQGRMFGKGDEEEFFGIREYQPGDPARNLHWPSTAKTGTLMTREMSKIFPERCSLYLDGYQQVAPPLFEEMIRFAAFFIQETLKMGNRVVFLDYETAEEKDWWKSLETLAAMQPKEKLPLPKQIERNLSRFLPERSLFFFTVSPVKFSKNDWSVLKTLQESNARIYFIVTEGENPESSRHFHAYLLEVGIHTLFLPV